MNNSNRADPDNSARHVDSAVSDVFNKTVITACTILFNRSSRIASHSSFICSLCFFPLASTCWRTTRLLRHTCTQCLRSSYGLTQTVGKLHTKIGNILSIQVHLCWFERLTICIPQAKKHVRSDREFSRTIILSRIQI